MKIAVTGKGGVGKSTISGILSHLANESGKSVLAIDADPDANLASVLGISEQVMETIIPISQQTELIEERTGAQVGRYGQIFKMNPDVSDIVRDYAYLHEGVAILVLRALARLASGSASTASTFRPWRARRSASAAAMVDFPTPPLPATASLRPTPSVPSQPFRSPAYQ